MKYCDNASKLFIDNYKLCRADVDDFIRTTEPRHKMLCNEFWNELYKQEYIKENEYKGYYCVSDENFVLKSELVKVGEEYQTKEGKSVDFISENIYSLKFSNSIIDTYLAYIDSGRIKMHPHQIAEVNEYIKANLFEFTISRPKLRVPWGIPVPNNESFTIYVWFEALLNYITVAMSNISKSDKPSINEIREVVKNSYFLHIIGKDITKFHCYLLPLMLIAADSFPSKLEIMTHHHFNVNNVKMSKSLNNSVFPADLITNYSYDAVRYNFISSGPQTKDVSLNEEMIPKSYYNGIADSYINLFLRVTNKKISNINELSLDRTSFVLKNKKLQELKKAVDLHFESMVIDNSMYDYSLICHKIHLILLDLNKLIQDSAIWKMTDKSEVREFVIFTIECIRIISIFLYPILPELSVNIHTVLGLKFNFSIQEATFNFGPANIVKLQNEKDSQNMFFNADLSKTDLIFVKKQLPHANSKI